jgi:hypothetical protein
VTSDPDLTRPKTERIETPTERSMRARAAAYAKWAQTDTGEGTVAARAAFLDRFERQVDPAGILPEPERVRRARSARKAYMLDLARRSAQARRRRARKASNAAAR